MPAPLIEMEVHFLLTLVLLASTASAASTRAEEAAAVENNLDLLATASGNVFAAATRDSAVANGLMPEYRKATIGQN